MKLLLGDCLKHLRKLPPDSVDLVFTSPPYEAQRTYDVGFDLKGDDWVQWAVERYVECCRVSRGLVAWVVQGYTKNYAWSATPALLTAALRDHGVKLRNPAIYKRHGIPGSGGPDWLRSDYEWVICSAHGKLPWSDNTAMGHPPKYAPGGAMSNRTREGDRVHDPDYKPPSIANPGNVIDCGAAGGGNMGSPLAHENEAPFPEKLAEFFVRSFCPPGGTVLDPFCGSGTTLAVAKRLDRKAIGIDLRESQIDLTKRRLMEESK